MNYYETLYIIHPALESGRLKDIILGVEDNLNKLGGNLLSTELWGKKKLAYFIEKQKYGTYVLIQFNGEGKCTHDFAVEMEHNPNILAYLTTNINKEDVVEQEEDLDTQIAGKTREVEKTEKTAESEEEAVMGDEIKSEEIQVKEVAEEKPTEEEDVTVESNTEAEETSTEVSEEEPPSPEPENESIEESTEEPAPVSEEDK